MIVELAINGKIVMIYLVCFTQKYNKLRMWWLCNGFYHESSLLIEYIVIIIRCIVYGRH